jgi:hypothetical protein
MADQNYSDEQSYDDQTYGDEQTYDQSYAGDPQNGGDGQGYDDQTYDQSYAGDQGNQTYDRDDQTYDQSYAGETYSGEGSGDGQDEYYEGDQYDNDGGYDDQRYEYEDGDSRAYSQPGDGYAEEGVPLGDDDEYSQQYDENGDPYYGSPSMPSDYYADEYDEREEDEDEEARLRRARRRRAWCCCLLLLCCLLILIILLIIFLLLFQDDSSTKRTASPTFAPFIDDTDDDYYYDDDIIIAPGVVTSRMAPYDENCDFTDQEGQGFVHVYDQCACEGEIFEMPEDVIVMRNLIVERLLPKMYDFNFTEPELSCDPRNLALLWLASGDTRDSGEIRQRYALGVTFFALNGTIWDYGDAWLTDLNECLWLGVQCNNRDVINSLALDTNNIFGLVRNASRLFLHSSSSFCVVEISQISCFFLSRFHVPVADGNYSIEGIGVDCHHPYSLDGNHPLALFQYAPVGGAPIIRQPHDGINPY